MATSVTVEQVELTIGAVKQSIASTTGSVSYLKMFIPVAIENIIHSRVNYEPHLFDLHKIDGTPYVTFSRNIPKNHDLFNVYHWVKDAIKDLDKKYLKQLYLIIRNKEDKHVIEHYCFQIKYSKVDSEQISKCKWESVLEATGEILRSINMLGEHDKLTANKISFATQVIISERAPNTYLTRRFEKGAPYVEPWMDSEISVGMLFTGYHRLEVGARADKFVVRDDSPVNVECKRRKLNAQDENRVMPQENERRTSVETNKFKSPVSNNKTKVDSTREQEISGNELIIINDIIYQDIIKCLCGITTTIPSIEAVKCDNCGGLQHCACVGCVDKNVPRPHTCYECHVKTGIKMFDLFTYNAKDQRHRISIAFLRLLALYCLTTEDTASALIDKLPKDYQEIVNPELFKYKIIYKKDEKYLCHMDALPNVISRLFNECCKIPKGHTATNLSFITID